MRPPPWLPPAPQRLTLPRAAFRVHPASDRSDRLPRPGLSPFALSTRSLGPPSLPEVSCRDRPIPPPLAPEVPALPVLLTQRPAARRLGHPRARWPRLWARPAPPGASAPPVRSARRALRVPRTPHSHCARVSARMSPLQRGRPRPPIGKRALCPRGLVLALLRVSLRPGSLLASHCAPACLSPGSPPAPQSRGGAGHRFTPRTAPRTTPGSSLTLNKHSLNE